MAASVVKSVKPKFMSGRGPTPTLIGKPSKRSPGLAGQHHRAGGFVSPSVLHLYRCDLKGDEVLVSIQLEAIL